MFVRTPEEAEAVPEDIVAVWPSELSMVKLESINERAIAEGLVDLENLSVTYPLTVDDSIDNWEEIQTLWERIPDWRQGGIEEDVWRAREAAREAAGDGS